MNDLCKKQYSRKQEIDNDREKKKKESTEPAHIHQCTRRTTSKIKWEKERSEEKQQV